jgi:hypothetical protein
MSKRSILLSVVVCLVLASCTYADTTVGKNEPGNGNCFPFTCNNSGNTTGLTSEYQQVYSASAFSGPETIYGLTFYFDNGGSTEVLTGTYDLFLSTTTASVNGLSGDAAANRGTNFTAVDVFHGGVNSDPSFTIALTTPFLYNPAQGNLLLEVMAFNQPNISDTGENAFLQADHSGDVTSRAWGSSEPVLNTDSIGLVTTFDTNPVAAAEPGSLSMLLLGLAVVFSTLIRIRK